MAEQLLSVGLDVGTTTSQMILSRLTVENQAGGFSVPELAITDREILYRGEVHFTPLLDEQHVDAAALKELIAGDYARAGITRDMVDTGAIIITGETSRRENARAVMEAMAEFAGDFVVATAGPDLESLLAAKGAGALDCSRETESAVLHMDIGGGTSNLTLIRNGSVIATGCLNVGGRLIKLDPGGRVQYVSPVLRDITQLKPGDPVEDAELEAVASVLVQVLEMAAGLRPGDDRFRHFMTREAAVSWQPPEEPVMLSFSGGVADCIDGDYPSLAFGDLGPVLGRAIRRSALCRGPYRLGSETIRATVIGAGCHSTQLSGSTVFIRNVVFPLRNLPVVKLEELSDLSRKLAWQEGDCVVALPGNLPSGYGHIQQLARTLGSQLPPGPVYLCMEQDMAKALGQLLALGMEPNRSILCIDRVRLRDGDYLDIGAPIGPALPVVVKTLVLK